ncbi:S1 family peptidase [Streptomyces eurocidicus]|uniref:Streptogrisin D n=1 Tax=Streptomyces eurocidicus TaxID=66423 RepID=A0A7W8BIL8_STREU|nr:S1 family peptidase [Streptomyces eurocidicus]MBB5123041.1 streptogrisin D [Streptomyces eurocidicus]
MQRSVPLRRRLAAFAAAALAALAAVVLTPDGAQATAARPGAVRADDPRLDVTMSALNSSDPIPGTAWGPDPATGRVVVTADPTVTGAKLDRLKEVLKPLGQSVELRRTTTELRMFLAGGDAIYGSERSSVRARCSLGFNVKRAGKPDAFLTAGHCGNPIKSWSTTDSGPEIALVPAGGSSFPGDDYAIAEYTAVVDHPSQVNLYNGSTQPITGAHDAVLDENVQRSGSTTGLRSGRVTGLNRTVTYPEGRVSGLTETNVCAEPGDSGGAFFAGTEAVGLTSGGSGDCTSGGTTFYQPVKEALSAFGATIG